MLCLLTVCARNPLLRATIPTITGAREGDTLGADDFDAALERAFPGYQKPKIRAATVRHISATSFPRFAETMNTEAGDEPL